MISINFPSAEVLGRLFSIAQLNTDQSRCVANFLLAWHNSKDNGGWDPTDLWQLESEIAQNILSVLVLVSARHRCPGDLGFQAEIKALERQWRAPAVSHV